MMFNSICTMLGRKTNYLLDIGYYSFHACQHFNFNNQNQFSFSTNQSKGTTQDEDISASSEAPIQINIRKQNRRQSRNNQPQEKVYKKNLIQLIRDFRATIQEDSPFNFSTFSIFCKEYSVYYKKSNHEEYTKLKEQIENLLTKCRDCQVKKFSLIQYVNVLDFIRITASIQYIDQTLFEQTKQKMFNLLDPIVDNINDLPLNDVCLLYAKLNPLYYSKMFSISSVLHDKLSQKFQQKKGLSVSLMQIFVLIKSMSKKQFLSFPDKKILQMTLLDLKFRSKVDNSMILQLANAFKDIQVQANISNHSIYSISRKICRKAIKIVSKGIKNEQIQKILLSKKSLDQNFQLIIQQIYSQLILRLKQANHSKNNIKIFNLVLKQLPLHHNYTTADKLIVIESIKTFCEKFYNETQFLQYLQLQLLDTIRNNFFREELSLLDDLMRYPKFSVKWSFIFEYSCRGVIFPLELIQKKLKQINNTKVFLDFKFIKMIVCVSKQSKLSPNSQLLSKEYERLVELIKRHDWNDQALENLIKLTYSEENNCVQEFHNQFHHLYLEKYLPKKKDLQAQKKLKKGQKSSLFKFWEYLLKFCSFQKMISFQLINNISIQSIYIISSKIKNTINRSSHPKLMLLLALSLKLQTNQISTKDSEIPLILQLLTLYINGIVPHEEGVLELYFQNMRLIVGQYQKFKPTHIPIINNLIIRVLNIHNISVKNSFYYRQYLIDLLNNPSILGVENTHQYFKTSIIRQALSLNLINQTHLSQIQYNLFSNAENYLLKSIVNEHKIQEFNPFNLTCYLKANKDQQTIQRDLNSIYQTVEKSTLGQLCEHLIHYSLDRSQENDKILVKICEQFNQNLQLSSINIIAILLNIQQRLKKIDFKLYQTFIMNIVLNLKGNLQAICLVNHLFILKIFNENDFSGSNEEIGAYRRSLWEYTKKFNHNGYVCLDIMLEISKAEDIFTAEDLHFVESFSLKRPLAYLKVLLLKNGQQDLIKDKVGMIESLFTKPTEKSIYTQYFQLKYKRILPMQRTKVTYMKKPANLTLQIFKFMQNAGINIKSKQIQGQSIYHINEQLHLFFTDNHNKNQLLFIHKFIRLQRLDGQIMCLPITLGKKQLLQLVHSINAKLQQKLSAESLSNIEQSISFK